MTYGYLRLLEQQLVASWDALWYLDWQYMSKYGQLIQTLLTVLEKDSI